MIRAALASDTDAASRWSSGYPGDDFEPDTIIGVAGRCRLREEQSRP